MEKRICQNCKRNFTIQSADFDFYKKLSVPPPTFCFHCRFQRRLAWRNERGLHRRACDLCQKEIIAMYPKGTPFPVYCRPCWYSDKWDPLEYGREYDFTKPFFEQFKALEKTVPHVALQVDNSVNCDFANQIADCKNCYLITGGSFNEDCMYSYRILNSRNVADSLLSLKNEWIYDCIECLGSAYLIHCQDSADSLELAFCYDTRNTKNSFMSSNARGMTHLFRNQPLSKAEYDKKRGGIDTGSYATYEKLKQEFEELKKKSPHKFTNSKNAVNFVGHTGTNVKNCFWCFNVSDLEDCRYCWFISEAKDIMDMNNGCCNFERYYEVSTGGLKSSDVKFCADAWPEVSRLLYCETCRNGSSDLFGCVSLRGKQYCILNKQYSKKEYEALLPKIIDHMFEMPYTDKQGIIYKYGEFFPIELSPFTYNDSAAQDYFPLSKAEAEKKGFAWNEPEIKAYTPTKKPEDLPDHIKDVPDSIIKEIIQCKHDKKCDEWCTGAFKIIPDELAFYRKMSVPIPRLCPNCRHTSRLRARNPINLWHRLCQCGGLESDRGGYANTRVHAHKTGHCPTEFDTSYSPDQPEIVYCESCYNNEVS